MIKLKRLGVVLKPKGIRDSVFAKFNAGMVADNGVVFPAGAYVHNGELYVCYGAADKYVALAKIGMNDLMRELERNRQ
jgi:predicted GH43/DUF377 family glycosyl hydrolase